MLNYNSHYRDFNGLLPHLSLSPTERLLVGYILPLRQVTRVLTMYFATVHKRRCEFLPIQTSHNEFVC